jgi:hypothetical protein
LSTLDEIYKKDIAKDKIIQKDLEKPQEIWLKCPLTKNHCDKAECSLWIVTYQRCCFVSIAKALDIMTSILDDRLGEEPKLAT